MKKEMRKDLQNSYRIRKNRNSIVIETDSTVLNVAICILCCYIMEKAIIIGSKLLIGR